VTARLSQLDIARGDLTAEVDPDAVVAALLALATAALTALLPADSIEAILRDLGSEAADNIGKKGGPHPCR